MLFWNNKTSWKQLRDWLLLFINNISAWELREDWMLSMNKSDRHESCLRITISSKDYLIKSSSDFFSLLSCTVWFSIKRNVMKDFFNILSENNNQLYQTQSREMWWETFPISWNMTWLLNKLIKICSAAADIMRIVCFCVFTDIIIFNNIDCCIEIVDCLRVY